MVLDMPMANSKANKLFFDVVLKRVQQLSKVHG